IVIKTRFTGGLNPQNNLRTDAGKNGTIAYDTADVANSAWTATFPVNAVDGALAVNALVVSGVATLPAGAAAPTEETFFDVNTPALEPGPAPECIPSPFAAGPSQPAITAGDTGVS